MTIKSASTLVAEALKEIKTISPSEALEKVNNNTCNLIDIRDVRELERLGRIENSSHIPRGMLEFWMDPDSQYFKEGKIDMNKEIVLFCAGGLRSALATKTLQSMGFTNISHIDGGFGSMQNSGFKSSCTKQNYFFVHIKIFGIYSINYNLLYWSNWFGNLLDY